ncbi:DUF302 domain-containing protein [Tsukamurella serpentis]
MHAFTLSRTLTSPYPHAVIAVREALSEVGFGVLTEIDIAATLKAKLGVDVPPRVILGACRPQLAHRALQADPRVATLLPCNVVISAEGEGSKVEIMDPAVMPEFTGTAALSEIATEARELLTSMLDGLDGSRAR